MSLADFPVEGGEEEVEQGVWPENVQAARLMLWMGTQWRMGPNGPVGLDYTVLDRAHLRTGTPPEEEEDAEFGLRVMEEEALEYFAEERARV